MCMMTMEREPRKVVFCATPGIIFLLALPLLYVDLLWGNDIYFEHEPPVYGGGKIFINKTDEGKPEELLLSRLVKEEDRQNFKIRRFACDSQVHSMHCVAGGPIRIDTGTMTVTVPYDHPPQEMVIRPYARQEDDLLLKNVTPVKILHANYSTLPVCQYSHDVPAVVFSSSGFIGNIFHEMNEIIIPLFITTRMFNSRVVFILEDYNPSFVRKYGKVLSALTSHDIIHPAINQSVHCFPGAVVGLKFHGHLALNSSEIPGGLSMRDFRQFLRESLHLKYRHVSEIRRPTAMLLSRRSSRRILNEEEVVRMMEGLGFRVMRVGRAKAISDLNSFAGLINSCSVFVGAHGAGLTNEIFLADGAVMVQVDLVGLEWAAATYYGRPARGMGVHYLRYKVEAEESSLFKTFGGNREHVVFRDPKGAFPVEAGREVYLNWQNVRVNVTRLRETMVEAISLVGDSSL